MREFLETTFGPAELVIVDGVLEEWRSYRGLAKDSPDVELAAAIILNLFREGNQTVESLRAAAARHRAFVEL